MIPQATLFRRQVHRESFHSSPSLRHQNPLHQNLPPARLRPHSILQVTFSHRHRHLLRYYRHQQLFRIHRQTNPNRSCRQKNLTRIHRSFRLPVHLNHHPARYIPEDILQQKSAFDPFFVKCSIAMVCRLIQGRWQFKEPKEDMNGV